MRPLKLQLEGFTSFKEKLELDFSGLDLFAITGPTGAGKSSLIDAIVFALYGQVPRVGDDYKQLISHNAERLSVMLEFGVGREKYRIARTAFPTRPSQQRLERITDGPPVPVADHVKDIGRISEQMFDDILGADFCIGILAGFNPNVFYEIAVAHSAGIPVILLCDKGVVPPFDLKDERVFHYDLSPRAVTRGDNPKALAELIENVRKLPINDNSIFIRSFPNMRDQHPAQIPGHRLTTLLQRMGIFLKDFDQGLYEDYWKLVTTHYIAADQP